MLEVTDKNFKEEVENFEGTVFVDFWASWCGPCKVMLPTFEKLAEAYSSPDAKFVKYEAGAEDCSDALRKYSINGVPTFIAFKPGQDPVKMVGVGDLEGFVKRNLGKDD